MWIFISPGYYQTLVNDGRARHKQRTFAHSLQDHSDNPLGAAVTLAHELGHNFGMNHDTPERGCGCRVTADRGGCIMTPSTGWVASPHQQQLSYIWLRKTIQKPTFTLPSFSQQPYKCHSRSQYCYSTLSPVSIQRGKNITALKLLDREVMVDLTAVVALR